MPSGFKLPSLHKYPRRTQAMIQRALPVFARYGGERALMHSLRVLDVERDHSIVEDHKINDPRGYDDDKDLNQKLATVTVYHPFKARKWNRQVFPSEDFEKSRIVVDAFDKYGSLRDNDLGNQDPQEYRKLIGKPDISVVLRLADLTQYGKDGQASELELSGLDPRYFYVYDTSRGRTEYELVSLMAKKFYSPLADLLGYRRLAGELYEIYYYNIDRGVYESVGAALQQQRDRIEMTKMLREAVIKDLKAELQRQGYTFRIKVRGEKHVGKIMDKADRYSGRNGTTISHEVAELHDLVAFTVILGSKDGRTVTQNDIGDFRSVANLVASITKRYQPLRPNLSEQRMFKDMITEPTDNGYQSYHVDLEFDDYDFASMEAIIRNERMEDYAEHGGAAHALYKGGQYAERILAAYSRIIRSLYGRRGSGHSTSDTSTYRRIKVHVQGEKEPRIRVIKEGACVFEAIMAAGIDLTNGFILKPKVSLYATVEDIKEIHLERTPFKGGLVNRGTLDQCIIRATSPSTREELLRMKKKSRW